MMRLEIWDAIAPIMTSLQLLKWTAYIGTHVTKALWVQNLNPVKILLSVIMIILMII